jgi:tubby-related protein 1
MTGKKRGGNKTSNYLISMDKQQLEKNSPFYLGKVRSNFLGTEFYIYDKGENPEECKDLKMVRKELAAVIYESNLLGARGPRKMRAIIPDIRKDTGQPYEWKPL